MGSRSTCRKVFISGGTGSVGRAMVSAFAANKDHVSFQYLHDDRTARQLEERFGAKAIQLDFSQYFVLPASDFDIVINNAGINICDVATHEVTVDNWSRTIQVNLTAPFLILRQCLPWMIKSGWGRIINVSSIYGLRAVEGNFPYTVSKHGMAGITGTVAKEYAVHGITCNEICPGPIESEMMREIAERSVADTGKSVEDYLQSVCEEIPAKRMATPAELAAIALFLSLPQAQYINGVSIPVDGALIA